MSINVFGKTIFGPSIVRSGLILHVDPANTKSYPGTGTTVLDLSGNSYSGTLRNGVTFAANAFGFDGMDDHIIWSSPSSRWSWTPSGSGLNTMTIDIWVKTTDGSGIVVSKPWNGNGEYNYWIHSGNAWYVSSGGAGYTQGFSSYLTGLWENITCIVTPTQVATYRNGSLSANFANHLLTGNTPTYGNSNLELTCMTMYPYGSTFDIPSHAVVGNVGLFRVYNRVLSATEVLQNYSAARGRFGR